MGWMANATPRPLYPQQRDLVPIVQEAWWVSGPVWTGSEDLGLTGTPVRPVRGRCTDWATLAASLFRLIASFRGLCITVFVTTELCYPQWRTWRYNCKIPESTTEQAALSRRHGRKTAHTRRASPGNWLVLAVHHKKKQDSKQPSKWTAQEVARITLFSFFQSTYI
jgi:hypothetical protein